MLKYVDFLLVNSGVYPSVAVLWECAQGPACSRVLAGGVHAGHELKGSAHPSVARLALFGRVTVRK